jgi:hypothetical protein
MTNVTLPFDEAIREHVLTVLALKLLFRAFFDQLFFKEIVEPLEGFFLVIRR